MSSSHQKALMAAALLIALGGVATAEGYEDSKPQTDMLTGGAPLSQRYKYFGAKIKRTTVDFPNKQKPGTIVVNTKERRLYFVLNEKEAVRYGIGVGRDGFTWSGNKNVTLKKEWPDWTPPAQMLARRPDLPRFMKGGEGNPLGARAMYLGSTLYRIHGSDEPDTIGEAVSSGCFRMLNEDVIDLYDRVKIGALVVVQK